MQGSRLKMNNGLVYEVREDYRQTLLRIRELEWFEFHNLTDNTRFSVRSAHISSVENLDTTPGTGPLPSLP